MISLGKPFVSYLPYVATCSHVLLVAKTICKSRALVLTSANPMVVIGEDQAIGPAEIVSDLQTMDESMDMENDIHMEDEAGPSTISTPVSPTPTVYQPPTPPSRSTSEPSELSAITINSTSASPTQTTLVGQSLAPPSPSTRELSASCQIRLSTTPVPTPVSPTPTVHQPPTPPICSTPEPSKLSAVTINSTSTSPTPMTLVGHQSSTLPSPSTHELSAHCQIGLLTTQVSTPVSPTPMVYQPPPPSHSTPEPSELSAVTINNKSVLHPMPPSSSQTVKSTKSLETASECQGREESQRFDDKAWWEHRMSSISSTLLASVMVSPPHVARMHKPTPKKKESQLPKIKVTTNIGKSAANNARRG